jgi:hypothetical protein
MSIFKIKIKPIVTERQWEVNYVSKGRKDKRCSNCGRFIPIGDQSTTFTKRISTGDKTSYDTKHTCGHSFSICTMKVAQDLNITLP